MHHFITGAAGFIGSHLVDDLLSKGDRVSGADDFSLGKPEHLKQAKLSRSFRLYQCDLSDPQKAQETLQAAKDWGGGPDVIWHLAANSDIPAGAADASVDFQKTFRTTYAIIEAAKAAGAKRIAFASTSAIYGERDDLLTEDSGPLLPISNYGAMKLASEAALSAAAEAFLDRIWIFRFPNVVGSRATHGAIYDFVRRLSSHPASLKVLGDGSQTKPYLHVAELIEAMTFIVSQANDRRNVFNIGGQEKGSSVAFIAQSVVNRVLPGTPIEYGGGDRGWVGDVPRFRYCARRLEKLGWSPKLSSDEAVEKAIEEIAKKESP